MRFSTGIHPRQWHRGAWLLLLVLAVLVLLLTHRPTGGRAFAMEPTPAPSGDAGTKAVTEPAPPPIEESPPPGEAATVPPAEAPAPSSSDSEPAQAEPAPTAAPAPSAAASSGHGYVAEIVDSVYTVGPAEFFALDLPTSQNGAKAVHLFGTVTTKGRNKDIMVRLFRAAEYDRWLKQKSGRKPQAFWTSPRSANLTLDQDLPAGPIVLLLDNGYSIRTPKKVTCQLQLRYQRGTETFDTEAGTIAGSGNGSKPAQPEDNLPTPRSNAEQELPPPPPPPPSGY